MDRKVICTFLAQNQVPGDIIKFRDEDQAGCVVIAANGMKFRFTNAQIVAAEPKYKAAQPKPRRKAPTKKPATKKPTTKTTTKKAPAKKAKS
jgi:hypothetical protein